MEANTAQQIQNVIDVTLQKHRKRMENSKSATKLIDVMKAIPLTEIPQSFFFYKHHPSGQSVNHRVIDN